MKDQTLVREPPLDDEVTNEALPIKEVGGLPPKVKRPSLALFGARRIRSPDKLILSSYVKLLEWSRPTIDALTPDQEAAQFLIRK